MDRRGSINQPKQVNQRKSAMPTTLSTHESGGEESSSGKYERGTLL